MKTTTALLIFCASVAQVIAAPAGDRLEPLSITFTNSLTATNQLLGVPCLNHLCFIVQGQSTGKDRSRLTGDADLNIQTDHNTVAYFLSMVDSDGDELAWHLSAFQHPLEFSDLATLGYYLTQGAGAYTLRRATGKYAGFQDKGTFTTETRFFPSQPFVPFHGEGTLTLHGATPLPPLPIPKHRP